MEHITAIVNQAAAQAERRKKRKADEISHCDEELAGKQQQLARLQREIRDIGSRKRRLQNENQQDELLMSLQRDGAKAWKGLCEENKWQKASVLAVLTSENKDELPPQLQERSWNSDTVPAALREDRDILLARLAHKSWVSHYISWSRRRCPLFQLPPQFQNDEEVLLAAVNRYPEIMINGWFPEDLFDNEEFFLAYVHSGRLKDPCVVGAGCNFDTLSHLLLSKFSERIRGSAAHMLEAAQHMRQTNAVLEHFAEGLADDCTFAKRLVDTLQETPKDHALSRFAAPVRISRDVVLALVRKNGRCLQDADTAFKGDIEIVRTACKNAASALVFVAPNSQAQRQLGKDRDFIMDVLSRWPFNHPGHPQLYNMLSPTLKIDRDVIVAARKSGNLSCADLPAELALNRGFWIDVIKRDSSFWSALPEHFEGDPVFARAVDSFCNDQLVADVFRRFPFLREERSIWSAVIASRPDLRLVIERHAPEQIRTDKELMKLACKRDDAVIELLRDELQQDREIVEAAVECGGWALQSIPDTAQRLYPDLVAKALSNVEEAGDEVQHMVATSLWTNMDVASAWFKVGGNFHSQFPEAIKDKPEFGLVVAKHCRDMRDYDDDYEYRMRFFRQATSVALRSNKSFMMQAVELDCFLFLQANHNLRRDVDLAMVACSGRDAHDLIYYELLGEAVSMNQGNAAHNKELEFWKTVLRAAETKVNEYEGFTKGLLRGISGHCGPECHLPMLMNGEETSLALKRLIADFVELPTGEQLRILRSTVSNLKNLPGPLPVNRCPYDCLQCDQMIYGIFPW